MIKHCKSLSRDMVESCLGRYLKQDWTGLIWRNSNFGLDSVTSRGLFQPISLTSTDFIGGYHSLWSLEMLCSPSAMPNESTRESCLLETDCSSSRMQQHFQRISQARALLYIHSAAVSEQHQTLLESLQSRAESVMHRGEQSQHSNLSRRPAFFYPDLLSQALFNKLTGPP